MGLFLIYLLNDGDIGPGQWLDDSSRVELYNFSLHICFLTPLFGKQRLPPLERLIRAQRLAHAAGDCALLSLLVCSIHGSFVLLAISFCAGSRKRGPCGYRLIVRFFFLPSSDGTLWSNPTPHFLSSITNSSNRSGTSLSPSLFL